MANIITYDAYYLSKDLVNYVPVLVASTDMIKTHLAFDGRDFD